MAIHDWILAMCRGNFLSGPGFETWSAGTSISNPADAAALADGWTLQKGGTSGATADFSRESTTIDSGTYSKKVDITGAGSSDSYLRVKQSVSNFKRFAGLSVVLGASVKVGTASKIRLSVYDGVTTAYSSYHTGDNTWQDLKVALTCSASISELTLKIEITSDFTGAAYLDSSFVYVIESAMSEDSREALEYFGPDDPKTLASLSVASLTAAALAMTGNIAMGGNKITGLGEATAAGDALRWEQLRDGWYAGGETWTYASASTFTVSGDQTAKYTKGTRLKFTQTTVKYAVVLSSTYGAPNTTVTVLVNTDYTIANAAITLPYYSYAMNPQGYPGWFNVAAVTFDTADIDSGSGGVQPTTISHRAKVDGATFHAQCNVSGVKNGAGRKVEISAHPYPSPAFGTVVHSIGHAYVENSSTGLSLETGNIRQTGSGTLSVQMASATDVADNATITALSWILSYPI